MATITKRNRDLPVNTRMQRWDTAVDANDSGTSILEGDIFDVETSLGYPAKYVSISVPNSGTSVAVRFNPTYTIYPPRPAGEMGLVPNPYVYVASGVTFSGNSPSITIDANTTYTMDRELVVKAIEVNNLDHTSFVLIVS